MKLTRRKGFNFFRSYYDVFNELENDADKVAFIEALLDRQFLGVKPKDLKGMAKFAYISQTNSIDTQVKGYEDKTKTKLNPLENNPYEVELDTPTQGGKNTPTEQEKEKEKEKEKVQVEEKEEVKLEIEVYPTFDDFWILYDKKVGKDKCEKKWKILTQETKEKIINYLPDYKLSQPDKNFRKNPETFLNNKSWNDELIKPPQNGKSNTNNTAEPTYNRQTADVIRQNSQGWGRRK